MSKDAKIIYDSSRIKQKQEKLINREATIRLTSLHSRPC